MRLSEVALTNFRSFEAETFAFPADTTVIVGDNGVGKSALLDAAGVAAGSILLGLEPSAARSIERSDVRIRTFLHAGTMTAEPQLPCSVAALGEFEGRRLRWQRTLASLGGRTDRGGARELRALADSLGRDVRGGSSRALPLVAFYSTGRLWIQKRDRPKKEADWLGPTSRLSGYTDSLEPASSAKLFSNWMRSRTVQELQDRATPPDLAAVRTAVLRALPDSWNGVDYDIATSELVATRHEGGVISDRLPFSLLSDGQRTMLALVADLAYRCAMLNPQLAERAPDEATGVVLIDEIDLHLHPRWQRTVLDDLRRAFPRLQLITTTHSPFVVQTRGPGEIIDLNSAEARTAGGPPTGPSPTDYRQKGLEDVTREALSVEPRWSEARIAMWKAAHEYYDLLKQSEGASSTRLNQLRQRLEQLTAPFADNPAYQAFLEASRAASPLADGER